MRKIFSNLMLLCLVTTSFTAMAQITHTPNGSYDQQAEQILKQAAQIEGEHPVSDSSLMLTPEESAQLDADRLMELIVSMPDGFRTVFNLYAIEGFSHKEIAKMLGLSEGGCRSQLSRARVWLQEKLKHNVSK